MTRVLSISLAFLLLTSMMWVTDQAMRSYPGTPLEVGKAFLKAYSKGDYATARKYIDQGSESAMDMLVDQYKDKKTPKFKCKVGDIRQDGESATLDYTQNGEAKTLTLGLVDGEWRVQFSKTDFPPEKSSASKSKSSSKAHQKDALKAGKAFLDAWGKLDFKKARMYVSKETESVYDMLVGMKESDKEAKPTKIVTGAFTIDGDHATLAYTEDGEEKSLALVKLDGSWFVAFEKSPGDSEGGMNDLERLLQESLDSAAVDSL
jgi:hypothetical protein